ncbi:MULTISPECIES: hypothetical protein [Arthrobacter]|jgi:hypothetical protein|uniref:Uncharacterized protein n=1 Tax=Arthrobacter bambusae TaxID=1338426 RepID=A0AAW8DIS4_9MICC|nr:hypothetical protein [Arthrobacter bambusae]MDP9906694.1 hypothetical protein [Arthrobacter bambusae]MDQ0130771.1 hypothetical protein [Arthrobacter bambusae]MDQ0182372.1 hypothetical protein [Arthrobacter bambusae]
MDALYQPNKTGFDALDELDQVDWSRLEHCYGKGVVSLGVAGGVSLAIAGDVSRSLAALRTDSSLAISDGLYSNICHQGTVYRATAYAVPFIAAVAAGNVPEGIRVPLLALLGDIAIGGSYVAPDGSYAGAVGDHVEVLVTESLATSMERLSTIRTPRLVALIQAIQSLLVQSTDARRDAVESAIDVALTPPATHWDRRP